MINELREFASLNPCEQRYIKRSIDIGLGRQDAFKLWARDASEIAEAVTALLQSPPAQAEVVRATEGYSWEENAAQLVAHWSRLTGKS